MWVWVRGKEIALDHFVIYDMSGFLRHLYRHPIDFMYSWTSHGDMNHLTNDSDIQFGRI